MHLALRTTVIIDPIANDYIVVDKDLGLNVGRMYQTHSPGGATVWRWFVQTGPTPVTGAADTLDGAKAGFRSAWAVTRPQLTTAEIANAREQQEFDRCKSSA